MDQKRPRPDIQRPSAQMQSSQHGLSEDGNKEGSKSLKKTKRRLPIVVITVIIVLAILAGGGLWLYRQQESSNLIDNSKYQAVLLSNGQWYFGKLQEVNDSVYKLTDVFYLEQQNSQDAQKSDSKQLSDTTEPVLIKLGNEIHAPEDSMVIKSDQLIFYENLKDSGQVAGLMKQYLDKNNK